MKLKTVLSAVTLGAIFISSSGGCNITDFSSENLLRPPKTMGDEAEIEQLLPIPQKTNTRLNIPKAEITEAQLSCLTLTATKQMKPLPFTEREMT